MCSTTRISLHLKGACKNNKKRFIIISTLVICFLFSGWSVPMGSLIQFAFPAAIDVDMIRDFSSTISAEDLLICIRDNSLADDIIFGIQSNLSGNVYSNIEFPDMQDEPIGVKIVKIILDRIFN